MRHDTRRALSAPEAVSGFALPESMAATLIAGWFGGYAVTNFFTRIGSSEFKEVDPRTAALTTASCDEVTCDGPCLQAVIQSDMRGNPRLLSNYDRARWLRCGQLCRIYRATRHSGGHLQLTKLEERRSHAL